MHKRLDCFEKEESEKERKKERKNFRVRGVWLEITKSLVEQRRVWSERREKKERKKFSRSGVFWEITENQVVVEKGMVGNTFSVSS